MRNGFKFGVLMFKKIRERLKSFRVRNIIFLLQPFERKKENVLNIFDIEDFLGSLLRENLLESLLRDDFLGSLLRDDFLETSSGRLLDDLLKTFDLGGKPNFFQNLGGNPKFY
ncbi:hypothetical protein IGI04_013000 [Brassica rapa subsp. trilocularis]|uniref:Uncharacterized protein n=1 Tax=Brassica rapa subsp. trilocularis TaxID=1813537 RepID=A0ABQ7N9N3_BRACM|nr:hypothetical protein IGI04_013000 [Brassica rapa subsp. trilocularis]